MEVIAKKSVLVRRKMIDGKLSDVKTMKGAKIDLSEEDAVKIWGALELTETQKKKLLLSARQNKYKRMI